MSQHEDILTQQIADVQGRVSGVEDYFDNLLKMSEFGFGQKKESLFDVFLGKSFGAGRETELMRGASGFAGGIESRGKRERGFLQEQYGAGLSELTQGFDVEQLGIGKARTDELQRLQDLIYSLRTAGGELREEITGEDREPTEPEHGQPWWDPEKYQLVYWNINTGRWQNTPPEGVGAGVGGGGDIGGDTRRDETGIETGGTTSRNFPNNPYPGQNWIDNKGQQWVFGEDGWQKSGL